jgi:hypothetical protein
MGNNDLVFIDLSLFEEDMEKILESNYGMQLKKRIKSKSKEKMITSH